MKKVKLILIALVLTALISALAAGCVQSLTQEQLWEKLDGYWFRTPDSGASFERDFIHFFKEDGELRVENAVYPASWGEVGPLTKFEALGGDKYKLTFSYPGFEGNEMDEPVAAYEFSVTVDAAGAASKTISITEVNGSVAQLGSFKYLGATLAQAAAAGFGE